MNLRKASIDDVSLIVKWWADQQYMGDYQEIVVLSKEEIEKIMLHHTIFFIIEKSQAAVGHINGWMRGRTIEIGFALVPNERAKGLGTEAIQMMLDHLFITKDSARIQVSTDVRNIASQRALEKAGFRREGTMRRSGYVRGQYRDRYLYSVIREEWKKPRILTDITG
ncbi:MAG: GNAT family N-acetyltransferase [Candidatus Bathyarchaeota archaeon]|nr:MAG: GNAT family N-acetyltransferase [Candidatus Bathyarchaeota archaeon]